MDSNGKLMSILMFPWLAHGHISPHLELAKKLLSQTNHFIIYLCSTPANFISIQRKIARLSCSRINFVELHLPILPNLPPHYHTTNGLPPHLMPVLKDVFDMASPSFSNILKTIKPDLLIYDNIQPWAAAAALSINIPAVEFIASSATMFAYTLHSFKKPGLKFPFSSSIYFHDYETSYACKLKEASANEDKVENRGMDSLELSCKIVLIRSLKEIEAKYIDYFSTLSGKKLVPLGPLAQDPAADDENCKIIQWLNKKDCGSTVFVSFGSEYFLSDEDLQEIAHGLELSGVNFIWVVRFPIELKVRVVDKLPKGFFERIGERGLVVEGWAPQAKILEHENVGGFVSHCGWSSVLEAMTFGVPIIAIPMHLDQPINARLVVEVGIGLEVLRNKNGKLQGEEVASVINEVMLEKGGETVRINAKKMREKIRVKGGEEIDGVVEELKKICLIKKVDQETYY